ncbi:MULTISPECIES: extracellular solute-binding protein [unclassified Rhizobium]|uniref:extracellular solute-binding protein n=1 Tax=unclassified Rhizobium TaxID=2613769 RepID=UPI0006F47A13|nr:MULTISPECIES: extracellular solute-binding protein [unclassified Rhizobium]KQV41797.1 putrescine/spermidine ABC transporter substrate-binding protein [Rhizobium sp. Root1212]KRD30044.1 putrescine/spermidine ABC transporter substrate-binding protein [Rhizobium sp. Root268]
MKHTICAGILSALSIGSADAVGELRIFNSNNYTNPKLIEKFEKEYDVSVTLDTFASNDNMLTKVRAGNTGYDVVVGSDYAIKVLVDGGLLLETDPNAMENFKNVDPKLIDVYWDPGRRYSTPWQMGIKAIAINTDKYKGPADGLNLLFDPPEELRGRINMLDDMTTVMHTAERYLGFPSCTADKAQLKAINDLLLRAKPFWRTLSYEVMDKMIAGDVDVSQSWTGATYRLRQKSPAVKFVYTKEIMEAWADNVVVLKKAPNADNAKLFQNFLMAPENAALVSEFAGYDSGIIGSLKFLAPEFANALEMNPPADARSEFVPPCPQDVVAMYNRI